MATELRAGRSGDRIPVRRDFPPIQTGPGAHPASCTVGTGSFPGENYGRGVLLTTHPLLVPWSWKSRAIPLPTLWATTGSVTATLYLLFAALGNWHAIRMRRIKLSSVACPPLSYSTLSHTRYYFQGKYIAHKP